MHELWGIKIYTNRFLKLLWQYLHVFLTSSKIKPFASRTLSETASNALTSPYFNRPKHILETVTEYEVTFHLYILNTKYLQWRHTSSRLR